MALPQLPEAGWERLQGEKYAISCLPGQSPRWCRVQAEMSCDITLLKEALRQPEGYKDIFPRIEKASWVAPGIAHMQLKMPMLFQSRDYVSVFQVDNHRDEWRLSFFPSTDPIVDKQPNVVRLPNYSGAWSLVPLSEERISISFYWNSDYGIPTTNWSRNRLRLRQGNEIMTQINAFCE